MSIDNMKKLMKEISADAETVMRLKDCHAKGVDAVVAFAKERGYEINGEDINQFNAQMKKNTDALLASNGDDSEGMINLKKFIRASEENSEIKNRLIKIGFGDSAAVAAYAQELGFVFLPEDISQLSRQMIGKSGELSDDELEMVAGGTGNESTNETLGIYTVTLNWW